MSSTHGITRADLQAVNLPRRRVVNRLMEALATLSTLIAVAALVVVVWSVARRGAPALNLDLLTKTPVQFAIGPVQQGLANAFAGSLVLVGLATLMTVPVGILIEPSGARAYSLPTRTKSRSAGAARPNILALTFTV